MPLPLAALLAPAAIQAGMGIYQMSQSKAKIDRPDYEIPESEKQALAMQKSAASQRKLPGYDQAMENIRGGTASAVSRLEEATDSGYGMLGAIPQLTDIEAEKQKDLDVASAEFKIREEDKYKQALQRMGQFEQQKWQWDKQEPYLDEAARASAMFQGGMSNIMGAATSAAGMAYEQETNKMMLDYMKSAYGNDAKAPSTTAMNYGTQTPSAGTFGDRSSYDLYDASGFGIQQPSASQGISPTQAAVNEMLGDFGMQQPSAGTYGNRSNYDLLEGILYSK